MKITQTVMITLTIVIITVIDNARFIITWYIYLYRYIDIQYNAIKLKNH